MTSTSYTDDLALELRLLDVPGTRIGEILAEVEAHVAETGEDPAVAFGPVKDYARERAGLADVDQSRNLVVRLFRGKLLLAVGGFFYTLIATWFLISGILALAGRGGAAFGLPPWAAIALGVVLLAAWWAWFTRLSEADRIVDPRTGREVEWDLRGRRKDA